MKTTLILAAITTLSLGTLALVRAQDNPPESDAETAPTPAETSEASAPAAGIRTEVATGRKLSGGTEEVIAIPVASVFAEGERFFVLARGTETADDFRETEVTLGRTDGIDVEVKTGLAAGDEVITVSVAQLRFPAFDDGTGASCGVKGCGPAACDPVTGVCPVNGKAGATCQVGETCGVSGTCKEGEACSVTGKDGGKYEAGASCEAGETCTVADTDGKTCQSGVACADCPICATEVDLTISAEEFFNGSFDVIFDPAPFAGQPAFCPPY